MNNTKGNVVYMQESKKFDGLKINRDVKAYNIVRSEEGDDQMSENNQMDTLFNEIKEDLREREERSRREISDREHRFEKQMDRYTSESVSREERIGENSKEREDRIVTILDKLETKMETHTQSMETMKNQNFWGNIALFVGMLAIVITLLFVA